MPNEAKSPSRSIVVTSHVHVRQPLRNAVVAYAWRSKVSLAFNNSDIAYMTLHALLNCFICKMYLCLRIGDLRAPQRHGKNHGREIVHLRIFPSQLSDFVPLRNGFYSFRAQTDLNHPVDPDSYTVAVRGVADLYPQWGHTTRNARDRSITHSLQRWVSTKSSISQLECILIFIIYGEVCRLHGPSPGCYGKEWARKPRRGKNTPHTSYMEPAAVNIHQEGTCENKSAWHQYSHVPVRGVSIILRSVCDISIVDEGMLPSKGASLCILSALDQALDVENCIRTTPKNVFAPTAVVTQQTDLWASQNGINVAKPIWRRRPSEEQGDTHSYRKTCLLGHSVMTHSVPWPSTRSTVAERVHKNDETRSCCIASQGSVSTPTWTMFNIKRTYIKSQVREGETAKRVAGTR